MMPDGSWIKIERREYILNHFKPLIFHPDDPEYKRFWQKMRKRIIEGVWVEQFGKLRFVPGRLGFFGVFGRFFDWTDEGERIDNIVPSVRDLEWHRAYYTTEQDGFSGWSNDTKYTSDEMIFSINKSSYKGINLSNARQLNIFTPSGNFKEYIPPRENLFMLHDRENLGRPLYFNQASNHIELGTRGGGKALRHGSKVYYENRIGNIEDCQIGDLIYDHNGELTTVLDVFPQGKVKLYRIKLRDGRTIDCCENHLWKVYDFRKRKYIIKQTKDLIKDYYKKRIDKRSKKYNKECFYYLPNNKPLDYEDRNFDIDPYLLGVLLGDGCFRDLINNTVFFTSSSEDYEEVIQNIILPTGFKFWITNDTGGNKHIRIIKDDKAIVEFEHGNLYLRHIHTDHKFWKFIEELDLSEKYSYEKHIPEQYLYGSIEQRFRLLKGLMDTDGSVYGHHKEFCTSSKQLAKDFLRLCRSLGINCKPSIKKTTHRDAYRILLYTDNKEIFNLKRKKDKVLEFTSNYAKSKSDKTSIVDIKFIGEDYATCIMVDNEEKLFLTDNFTITHNSYWSALGEVLPDLITNAAKSYNPGEGINTQASIEICSAGGGKGDELLEKVVYGMEAFANPANEELGVIEIFDNKGKKKVNPIPFFRLMKGSTKSGNKENPWRNEYDEQIGENDWKSGGFSDRVYNTSHSPNQKDAAQKSAGGRRTRVKYEEGGTYVPGLLLDAWGNNEGLVSEAGYKQAAQSCIGTSGNLDTIQDMQKIMTNPQEYRCLVFEYTPGEKTGFFLPVYMVDKRFKDADGNTNVEEAKTFHEKLIQDKINNGEPTDVILNWKMNNPIEIQDMWIRDGMNVLPVEEAKKRRNELLKGNLYKLKPQPIELYWDSSTETGVNYNILNLAQCDPFFRFPFDGRKDYEGAFLKYIDPEKLKINGIIPDDMVWMFVDPYVADEWDKGGSLGAIYFVVNPKYIPFGKPGNKIAAVYVGKPRLGTDRFCEIACQGYALYGNGKGTVWYEANRLNDKFRAAFIKNNRLLGLCSRPQFSQGSHLFLQKTTHTGYLTGANKSALWTGFADWLKSEMTFTENGEEITCRVIETIDDLFLLEQIIAADGKINVDAVSAMQGISLALGESEAISQLQSNNNNSLQGLIKYTSQLAKHKKYRYNEQY